MSAFLEAFAHFDDAMEAERAGMIKLAGPQERRERENGNGAEYRIAVIAKYGQRRRRQGADTSGAGADRGRG